MRASNIFHSVVAFLAIAFLAAFVISPPVSAAEAVPFVVNAS